MEHGNVIIVNILWDKKKRYLFCANGHLLFTSRMKKTNITKIQYAARIDRGGLHVKTCFSAFYIAAQ